MDTLAPHQEVAVALPLLPAAESREAAKLRERYGLFIGGSWTDAQNGASYPTVDPATEFPLADVAAADASDVDRAVRAARRAYDKYWRKMRPSERAKYLYRIARTMHERADEAAMIETLDSGKPIRETRAYHVAAAQAEVFYHAGWADKLEWAVTGSQRARPLGVVGAIAPSAAPLLAACRRIAPALACGNAIVYKPARTTPLSALWLASVVAEADLPPGTLNVVTGDKIAGNALAEHPDIDALAFSGSAETGKSIRRATAGTRTRLSVDLGGVPALIVFEDAPLDQAVDAIVAGAFAGRGLVRYGGGCAFVQEGVAAEFIERLRERLAALHVGDPLDLNTDVGPLVSRSRRDRIAEYVRAGVEEGATFVQFPGPLPGRGYFFGPGFFCGVTPAGAAAAPDVDGPVLTIQTFRTPDEAIARANAGAHSSSAAIWTDTGSLALYAAARLRTGVVWGNTYDRFDPSAPFGGYGESGIGPQGGIAGLRAYLESQ